MEKTVFFRKLNSLIPEHQSVRQFCLQHGIPEQRFTDWKRGANVSQKWLEKLSKIFDKPVDWFLKSAADLRPGHYCQSFGMMTRYLMRACQDTFERHQALTPDQVDAAVLDSMKRIHEVALMAGVQGVGPQPRGLLDENIAWAARQHRMVIEEYLPEDHWVEYTEQLRWLYTVLERIRSAYESPGKSIAEERLTPAKTRSMPLYLSTVAASPLGRRIEEHDYESIHVLEKRLEARQASTGKGALIALKLAPEARSMEPYLMPGDIVVVDTTKGRDAESFEEGAIYAVRVNKQKDEVSLKRVYRTDDTLLLSSDNPDKHRFPDIEAPVGDLTELVVGRYLLIAERPDSVVPPPDENTVAAISGGQGSHAIDPDDLAWTHPLRRIWNLRRSRETLTAFIKRGGISVAELRTWYSDPNLDLGSRRLEQILDALTVRGHAKRRWARCGDGPLPKNKARKAKTRAKQTEAKNR